MVSGLVRLTELQIEDGVVRHFRGSKLKLQKIGTPSCRGRDALSPIDPCHYVIDSRFLKVGGLLSIYVLAQHHVILQLYCL
jgi:hypothetical protein